MAIRRDNCPLLRDTVIDSVTVLMDTLDAGKAIKVARKSFHRIANKNLSWEDLTISKTLGEEYVRGPLRSLVVPFNPLLFF